MYEDVIAFLEEELAENLRADCAHASGTRKEELAAKIAQFEAAIAFLAAAQP